VVDESEAAEGAAEGAGTGFVEGAAVTTSLTGAAEGDAEGVSTGLFEGAVVGLAVMTSTTVSAQHRVSYAAVVVVFTHVPLSGTMLDP